MKKAVAIPYVIAIILGIIVLALIGYWFFSQGKKAVGTGSQAECDALKFNYCRGFEKWDLKCGGEPKCGKCNNGKLDIGEECDPSDPETRQISCLKDESGDSGVRHCKADCSGYGECV